MSLKPTKVVESFYQSNDKDAESIRQYLHPEAELSWYGTTGLKNLDVEGILGIRDELFLLLIRFVPKLKRFSLKKKMSQFTLPTTYVQLKTRMRKCRWHISWQFGN